MIFLDIELNEWIKKHKIIPIEENCKTCHELLKSSLPVVTKHSYGLISPEHSCNKDRLYTFVPKDEKVRYSLSLMLKK